MFTTGRLVFTLVFIVAFATVMIWAYRKDLRYIKQWFPKPWLILLAVTAIVLAYYAFSKFL